MICYLVTHIQSGKRYIGISDRALNIRKAEHESHAAAATFNTLFHSALRKYGKDNFTWKVLAEGDGEVIKILERVLVGQWRTYGPFGFNSTNIASEFELPLEDDELKFFEDMDTNVAKLDVLNDLNSILNNAKQNKYTQETIELIETIKNHLDDNYTP